MRGIAQGDRAADILFKLQTDAVKPILRRLLCFRAAETDEATEKTLCIIVATEGLHFGFPSEA